MFSPIKLRATSWTWLLFVLLSLGPRAAGRTVPNAADPPGFFTAVGDKLLRSTFAFGITNIPVYSNGVYVYTPAMQRLLQLSANLCDASNTNNFPSVFRPLFACDPSNNVCIIGYLQVTNVSGPGDPQLAAPYEVAQLPGLGGSPIADTNGPVNVYGVPWIIGAKKGLPNFNQLSLINEAQVTRKLEITRNSLNVRLAIYSTNQMYILGFSNLLGISFWNSYSNAYPRPVTVFAADTLSETLTNGRYIWTSTTNFSISATVPAWPGARWTGTVPNAMPSAASFVTANWTFNFLSPMAYNFNSGTFDPIGQWQSTYPPLPELPQFGLLVTNWSQAYLLDGSNVIDYVQLCGPVMVGGLNQALADPDFPSAGSIYYQWSTNLSPVAATYGVLNQLWISGHPSPQTPAGQMPPGGLWSTAPTPMGEITPPAEAAFYDGFFTPSFQYNGQAYVNNQLSIQAPYTPARTVYSACLLQANDPLIHYLASDLAAQPGIPAVWPNGSDANAAWYHSDTSAQPLPSPPTSPVKGRYQPWGASGQMAAYGSSVDANNYNLAIRDPLAWAPDSWSFPTNLTQSLSGLGQVHRGTPWQTFYLKSTNILLDTQVFGAQNVNVGLSTWMSWTGDFDVHDAVLMAPAGDWRLAGLLMSLLNTNDPTQLFPVNDPSVADWENLFNGLVAYSNSAAAVFAGTPLQFDTYIMASNSPQAVAIAGAVVLGAPLLDVPPFYSIGDILATPSLTTSSPFLNPGSSALGRQQWAYGISDAAYEAIPSQLLLLLRPDSIGSSAMAQGRANLQFSGADGYTYLVQVSTNLADWTNLATNQPVQGTFAVPVTSPTNSPAQFFRTRLLP